MTDILCALFWLAVFAGICLVIRAWLLDCEDEDRRLNRKPRSSFWLR